MSARSIKHSVEFTLEELGNSNITVDFEVQGTFWPGCAQTWEEPGDPDEFEIESVEVYGAFGSSWEYFRNDRLDWFKALDEIILAKVLDDKYFEIECLERMIW